MRCPTLILSPGLTWILDIFPEMVEGMVATAFSFSSSNTAWFGESSSPSFTKRLTTVPESAPSPSGGNFKSIAPNAVQFASKRGEFQKNFDVGFLTMQDGVARLTPVLL